MHISEKQQQHSSQRVNCFHLSELLGWPLLVARPHPAIYRTRSTREVSEAFWLALGPHQSISAVPNSWNLEMLLVCTTILMLEIQKWVAANYSHLSVQIWATDITVQGPSKIYTLLFHTPTMCGMSLMIDSEKLDLYFYLSFLRKLL